MAKPWTNRWIHYWLGIVSALPVVVILVTGLLLQVGNPILGSIHICRANQITKTPTKNKIPM